MSVPVLVTLPDSCAATAVMGLEVVVGETTSPFTMNSQQYLWPGERWVLSFNLPAITSRALAAEWKAFGLKMKGKYNRFLCGDPLGKVPRGVATGTPVIDGAGQTGNVLATSGWTTGVTGIMLKGDYFQLGTGMSSTLHMLTEDANSDGSGDTLLNFEPSVKTSPADGAVITVQNPRGLFKLTSNSFTWAAAPGPVWRMSFDAVEAIDA